MTNTSVVELAKTHGAENLRFFFPARPLRTLGGIGFTSSDDERVVVEAKAVEKFNRKVEDGYKIFLQPVDPTYAYRDFYTSDYEGLCEELPDLFYVKVLVEE